jgi:uncharacterized metal-binding protein YceD (DUF177 family)
MKEDFIVPLNGLPQGHTSFRRRVGKEFFERFENSEILAAGLDVLVDIVKSGDFIGIDGAIDGDVTVVCDRCLDDLVIPTKTGFKLSIKFGPELADDSAEENGREIIYLPESDGEYDLSQVVYDYICTSLPVQRVHPEGLCNPEVTKYLNSEEDNEYDDEGRKDVTKPFASLKSLLDNKEDNNK